MISRYASLRQGLVGAWCPSVQRCGSGFTLPDLSGYGNNGSLVNMDPGTNWVASGSGLALDFDGSNDVVTFSNPNISFGSSASFTTWLRLRDATPSVSTSTGLIKTSGGNNTHYPWVDGVFYSNIFRSSRVDGITLSTSVDRTQWHLLSVTTNAERYVVRQNLIVVADVAAQAVAFDRTLFTIGADQAYYLKGQLDDIRIYNRALTPTEIQQLYTGGRGVGLMPERIKHRRKTTATAFNRRRRILIGASQ